MFNQINLLIMPTDQCNMRCKYCFHGCSGYSIDMMPIEVFKRIISVVSKSRKQIQVVWHGGEPLCAPLDFYKQAYSFCDEIEAHIRFSLQTNASNLSEEIITFFKDRDTRIGVSYDGLTNEEVRGNTDKVLNGIRLLQEQNMNPGAIMVVTKKNIGHLIEEYNYYKSINLSWKLNPLFIQGAANKNQDLAIDILEYSMCFCELFKYWIYDNNCNINVQTCLDIAKLVLHKFASVCTYSSCVGKWFCINHSGDIYPCDRLYMDEFKIANICDISSFDQIYEFPVFQSLLKMSIARRKVCMNTCSIYDMCYGGCNASAYLGSGISFIGGDMCRLHKRIIQEITPIVKRARSDSADLLNPTFLRLL